MLHAGGVDPLEQRNNFAAKLRHSKRKEIISKRRSQLLQKAQQPGYFTQSEHQDNPKFIRIRDSIDSIITVHNRLPGIDIVVNQVDTPGFFESTFKIQILHSGNIGAFLRGLAKSHHKIDGAW